MYTVSGSTWQPLSTQTHASNILSNMNAQLQAQSLPIVTATVGNVLWYYCLAAGQEIAQLVDQPLNAAKNSFDVSNCDDNQIYSLLPLTGTTLIPGSYSSMYVTFTAKSTGTLTVPSGTHVIASGLSNRFLTQSTLVVTSGQSASVYTVADTAGPIIVVPGQVNATVEVLSNFASVTNASACLVGSYIETAAQARARILAGNTVGNNLNGLILALRGLPGITGANAYFNSGMSTLALSGTSGTINLPARNVYMVVVGSSSSIASTYWNLMNGPTYGTQAQTVVTLSNQNFTVNYDYATAVPIYVQVYIQNSSISNGGYAQALYNMITAISVPMGTLLTSEYMIKNLLSFPWANIEGVLVSLSGSNYSMAVQVPVNGYAQFSNSNIAIVLQ
jgi:hypothetical protein